MDHFNPDTFGAVAVIIGVAIFLVIYFGVLALICHLVSKCYKAIPAKHRAMEPGMVWLLMIPCFNIIWNFWVYQGLSKSYKAYFDSEGDNTVGDCYAQMALIYCIVNCFRVIPYLGILAWLGAVVLLIVYLVKVYDLKAKIKA